MWYVFDFINHHTLPLLLFKIIKTQKHIEKKERKKIRKEKEKWTRTTIKESSWPRITFVCCFFHLSGSHPNRKSWCLKQQTEKVDLWKNNNNKRSKGSERRSEKREEKQKGVLSQFSSCLLLSFFSSVEHQFFGFLVLFFVIVFWTNHQRERERERERWKETTNKREPWPTGLFDCCFWFNILFSFLFLIFFFFSFSMCFCVFIIWKKKGRRVWRLMKSKTFSKLIFVWKRRNKVMFVGFLCPLCLGIQTQGYSDDLEDSSSTFTIDTISTWTISSVVLSWYWSFYFHLGCILQLLLLLSFWASSGVS